MERYVVILLKRNKEIFFNDINFDNKSKAEAYIRYVQTTIPKLNLIVSKRKVSKFDIFKSKIYNEIARWQIFKEKEALMREVCL